jgi:hypothetical protein
VRDVGFIIGLWLTICATAVALALTQPVPLQKERAVFLQPWVRQYLAEQWDSTNARQHERAYCLGAQLEADSAGDSTWVVYRVTRASAWTSGPYHVGATCGSRPTLHTHVPTTCAAVWDSGQRIPTYDYASCVVGGQGLDVTWPSPFDQERIDRGLAPFEIIQFRPHGFTVYYPRRL